MEPYYVTIEDLEFRTFLKHELPAAFNENDQMDINHGEVRQVRDFTIIARGIRSLSGIDVFSSLSGLYCEENQLSTLDLRENLVLRRVWCASNRLTKMKLAKNPFLETLNCAYNQLTCLDLGENTALKLLHCQGNLLTSIDLTSLTSISRLIIGAGEIIDGIEKNPLEILKINEVLKTHKEIKKAKHRRRGALVISTHKSDGTVVCPDYNPITDRCNRKPKKKLRRGMITLS